MAMKKRTSFSDRPVKMDDLDFTMAELDTLGQSGITKKRKPITRVLANVAKGSLGHFTSESFIRHTLAEALPKGYDTTIEAGFRGKESVDELYHTAGKEWRKVRPEAQRLVKNLTPAASKALPRKTMDKLKKFSEGSDYSNDKAIDPDEQTLRQVMGELEMGRATRHARERQVDETKRNIRDQVKIKQHKSSMKVLASMDARLARMQSFNDQVFSRYQRRSLEVQYRQYFTMRDMLKLQAKELTEQRAIMAGILHNTGLPDTVKMSSSDFVKRSIKTRLTNRLENGALSFGDTMLKDLMKSLTGNIKSAGSNLGMGLSAANMGKESMSSLKDLGINPIDMLMQQASGAATGAISSWVLRQMMSDLNPHGKTSQLGAKAGRRLSNLPSHIQKYASTPTKREGFGGWLEQLAKDALYTSKGGKKSIGGSALLDAGEPAFFRKKTRDAVETVMPGYLSRILHELTVMRTGKTSAPRLEWNAEKDRFTSRSTIHKNLDKRLIHNSDTEYARGQAQDFADKLLAGKTVSAGAHHALVTQIIQDTLDGKEFEPSRYLKTGSLKHVKGAHAKELKQALRKTYRSDNGKLDHVRLNGLHESYNNLRNAVPNLEGKLGALNELGYSSYLRKRGFITQEGDSIYANNENLARHLAGQAGTGTRTSTASKNDEINSYGGIHSHMEDVFTDNRRNLYKKSDLKNPVIFSSKVFKGSYTSALSGRPIKTMAGILEGVRENGNLIVSAPAAANLVTTDGVTLPELVAQTESKRSKNTGKVAKVTNKVKRKLAAAGRWADDKITGDIAPKVEEKLGTPQRRRETYNKTKDDITAAAKRVKENPRETAENIRDAAIAGAAMGRHRAKGFIGEATTKAANTRAARKGRVWWRRNKHVKNARKHVLGVKQYATHLYKDNSERPIIAAQALKNGGFYSQETGEPIKHMEQVLEGVVDKDGNVIVSKEEAQNLRTSKGGEKLAELVTKASATVDKVKGESKTQYAKGKVQAAKAPGMLSKLWHKATGGMDETSKTAMASGEMSAEAQGLKEVMEAFKEGNFARLEAIAEAIDEMEGGGVPGVKGPRKKGLFRRGAGGMWKGAKFLGRKYKGYVKSVLGAEWKAAKWMGGKVLAVPGALFKKRAHLGKEPADVYVKGETTPRLTKGEMEAGGYFNQKKDGSAGDMITCPADIKGPVMDKTGNTIISKEDFKKTLTDHQGRSLMGSAIHLSGWVLGKAANFLGGYYAAVFKGLGFVARGGLNLVKSTIKGALGREPIDVYVQGDTPWKPRLLAIGMRAGSYYCLDTKKLVRCPDDIQGDVVDIKDHGNIHLSKQDIAKGLETRNHKPIKLKGGVLSKLIGSATGLAGTIGTGYLNLLGHMTKAGFSLASAPFRMVSRIFGGRGGKLKMKPGQYLPTADQTTHHLLEEILDLLDDRLKQNKKTRRGSWREEFAKRKAAKEAQAAGKGPKGSVARRGGLMGLLGSLFHRKRHDDDEDDQGEDGDTNYYGNSSDSDKRRRRKAKKRLKRMRKAGRAGKWGSRLGKLGGLGKYVKGSRVGRLGGRALGFLGKSRGLAAVGRGTMGMLGGIGRVGLNGAKLALGMGGSGEALALAGGLGETVAGAGSMIAGAAGAAAEGIGAAASLIGGVLSLPVILGAAAVAAVGAAAYYGYKYYGLKKKAPLRKLRMAQYGIDMDDDVWPAGKVQKLEGMVMPYVRIQGGKAKIDGKAFSKKTDDLLKLFDLKKSWYNPTGWFHDTDKQDLYNQDQFYQWLGNRFRPVFCTWMGAMHSIAPGVDLSDADSKLKDKQKRALLKAVYAIDSKIYDLGASPFQDDEIVTGKKIVTAAYEAALKDLGPEKKDGKKEGKGKGKAASAAAGGIAAAAKGKGKGAGTKGGVAADTTVTGSVAAAMKNTAGKGVGATIGLTATGALMGGTRFLPDKLSALMSVRFKTYGLNAMVTDRVRAVFLLETDVMDKLSYDNKGNATFSGDAGYFFDTYSGYFGVSSSDEKNKLKWFSWFAKRFMPTLLQFATAVKHANKSTDPRDADNFLSPAHLLNVANLTKAAVFRNKDASTPVWSFTDSPFGDDVTLNTDVTSVEGNIKALEEKVKQQKIAQEQAKKGSSAKGSKTKSDITKAGNKTSAADVKKQMNAKPPHALPRGLDKGSIAAQRYMKTGSTAAPNVGTPVKQPGHGTAGDINKIPMPTGAGLEGVRATIEAAAKMTGMDPQVLETFAGIESAWRPNAHAKTSSAAGMFQFVNQTWQGLMDQYAGKYGINPDTPPTDPRAASLLMGEFTKQNMKYLKKHLGRNPTDTDLYLAHFLGAGGAVNLLKSPANEAGSQAAPKAAHSNQAIFYQRGGMPRTVADVVKLMNKKVAHYRNEVLALPPDTEALASASDHYTTTTTANGGAGGKGGLAASAARSILAGNPTKPAANPSRANALANISPPSSGKHAMALAMTHTGDYASDPVVAQRHARQLKARIADEQARVTQEVQGGHSADMVALMKHQAKLQQQMVHALANIEGHTGNLSKKGIKVTDAGSKTIADADAPRTPPGSKVPVKDVVPLPTAAVSVRRTQYG